MERKNTNEFWEGKLAAGAIYRTEFDQMLTRKLTLKTEPSASGPTHQAVENDQLAACLRALQFLTETDDGIEESASGGPTPRDSVDSDSLTD